MADVETPTVILTPDLDEAIQRRIASGRYGSRSEVIRAALRVLERDEQAQVRKLAAVDTAIARGIADREAGRVMPIDDAFARIRHELGIASQNRDR